MSETKLFTLTENESVALKTLVNAEIQRLMNKKPRNETMIAVFGNILHELKNGRPLS